MTILRVRLWPLLRFRHGHRTPIPRNYVGDFDETPRRRADQEDEPIQLIVTTTLTGYIGKILKILQYKFPDHEDFRDLDLNKPQEVPEFWSRLQKQFMKACDM